MNIFAAMDKISVKDIYGRMKVFLTHPEKMWRHALQERHPAKEMYRNYLFPIAMATSMLVLLLGLVHHDLLTSLGLAAINLLSTTGGSWIAYLIFKEYVCGKLGYKEHHALNLTIYSAAIFIVFHSIGAVLDNMFVGQLFILFSFIFIRTLYKGLDALSGLQTAQKTNALIIGSLSIICLPIIFTQILTIVFGVSAFNV